MVTEVNRSIMHPVHIVQGVSNAPCAYSSIVQRFSCINDGVATDKTTPRLIQFHTFKNAANPPFLGGFSIFSIVAA